MEVPFHKVPFLVEHPTSPTFFETSFESALTEGNRKHLNLTAELLEKVLIFLEFVFISLMAVENALRNG